MKIENIKAIEILDSRGNPTVECHLIVDGIEGEYSVPSGASTGIHEALELRDQDETRYQGLGVQKAINNINSIISQKIINKDFTSQIEFDQFLLKLDGTKNKSKLGANAILALSLAFAKATSQIKNVPFFRHLKDIYLSMGGQKSNLNIHSLPEPSFNIFNGGKHGQNGIEFQEFMICPKGIKTFRKKLQAASEIFHNLKTILKENNLPTGVGDEGGFAPPLNSNTQALDLISQSIEKAGYKLGEEIFFILDPAASEFYNKESQTYQVRINNQLQKLNSDQMIEFWSDLVNEYPIINIEDGLAEDDWDGWIKLNQKLGNQVGLIGDDLLVTNAKRLQIAIDKKACNAILIKPNQIGSLTETLQTIILAQKNNFELMISHRSGETTDTSIADLAVAVSAEYIKSGSLSRGERIAKYNRLLKIEIMLEGK
jgi:enolase